MGSYWLETQAHGLMGDEVHEAGVRLTQTVLIPGK